jgi:release factor glutamine methyltransferase
MARRLLARTSVRDALDSAVIALGAAGCDTPRLDAELLLAHVLGVGRAALIVDPERGLEPDEARAFMDFAARRREREPVAYILGSKGFRTIELAVDARVLVPRPETEHVVEAALDLPAGARVVDVGTGSGAIALALKDERADLVVTGSDVAPEALVVARANGERLGLDVAFVQADGVPPGDWDVVVSNPPYVAEGDPRVEPGVRAHEPHAALYAGADGLDLIRRLVAPPAAPLLVLEVGEGQAAAVAELATQAGYARSQVRPDLAGSDRIVVAWA